jgi:hypothetical protein
MKHAPTLYHMMIITLLLLCSASLWNQSRSQTGRYTISPMFDLFAGFSAYGFHYEETDHNGVTTGLTTTLYGFILGVRMILPKRDKDPDVFREFRI